jgi:hypothetical protein
MEEYRNCPSCNNKITYSAIYFFKRAEKKGSLCKKCACTKVWEKDEIKKKASDSRKKYLSELSEDKKSGISKKISYTNKKNYEDKSEEEKKKWKKMCSDTTKERWKDPIYKDKLRKKLSENNWSKRDDSKEIKKKQVESRIENNGGLYHKGSGRCKEFEVEGIKCYGTYEKKYIEILINNNLQLPIKPKCSINTIYGKYTPDFEFDDFYVDVKSIFTYKVLIGEAIYSKNKVSNPNQLNKMIEICKSGKKIKIALVENEIFNYLDLE